jgi:hypothetical protein
MEATESLKYPFLITWDTSPSKAVLEVFKFSPSDGCPATATYLASTQALRSRRVSSVSKIPDCVVAHRSDRCSSLVWHCCNTVFGSSVLALLINQGTQWFSGEPPETPRTRCSLRQSPLMTRLPRSPCRCGEAPQHPLDSLEVPNRTHPLEGCNLFGVGLDASLGDDVS